MATTPQEIAAMSATPIFCSICGLSFYGPAFAAPHHPDYTPATAEDNEHLQIDEAAEEYHSVIVRHLSWQHEATLLSDVADEFPVLEQHYKGGKRAGIGRYQDPETDYAVREHGSGNRAAGGTGELREGIRIEEAVFTGVDDVFCLSGTGEQVKTNDHVGHDEMGRWTSMYRIAVHRACMAVARDFVAAQERRRRRGGDAGRRVRVGNLRALWKVLRMRWDALDNMLMLTRGEVLAPAYAALKGRSVYKYPSFGNRDVMFHERWVEQDPRCEDVLGDQRQKARMVVGATLLAPESVERGNGSKSWQEAFRHRFYALPQELQDVIADQVVTGEGLDLKCTRILGQATWMEILVRGQALPWLGALDRRALNQATIERLSSLGKAHPREREQDTATTLDWELLVRRLSQPILTKQRMSLPLTLAGIETVTITSFTECLSDFKPASLIPDALRSRKWRWGLLESMYVCDVLPVWTSWMQRESEQDPALPRYWDEYGERVWPVERLTGDVLEDW